MKTGNGTDNLRPTGHEKDPDPQKKWIDRKNKQVHEWVTKNLDNLPEDFTIMRLDYDLFTTILTRERVRLVNHLREYGPYETLQELADDLGRDKTAISRDLSYLEATLVKVEKVGRRKRIWAPDKPVILY